MPLPEALPLGAYPYDVTEVARSGSTGAVEAKSLLLAAHRPLILKAIKVAAFAISQSRGKPYVPSRAHVEEALQAGRTAFLQVLARFDPSRGVTIGAFARPFVRSAVRGILEQYAEEDDYARVSMGGGDIFEENDIDGVELADELDIAEQVVVLEERRAVMAFVASLPPRQRYLVVQLYWAGSTQADVARQLGVTRVAINRQLARIHERGREVLARFAPRPAA